MSGTPSLPQMLRLSTGRAHPGWGGVPEYSGWQGEQMSWKETCTIGDWSFLFDAVLEGPDALKLLSDTSINSYAKFPIGAAKHIVHCSEDGKVIAEGVLMRLGEDRFATQSIPAVYLPWKLTTSGGYDVSWHPRRRSIFQVAGPNTIDLLQKVTGESLRDVGFMRFREVTIAGHTVEALRQGMSGEIGFELHCPAEVGKEVYAAILSAGEGYGLRQLGGRTALINHLEACFPTAFWNYLPDVFALDGFMEFMAEHFDLGDGPTPQIRGSYESDDIRDYLRSPFELGWGKSVKFDHDFLGRSALELEAEHPIRQIVTLEFNSEDVVKINASLFDQGTPYEMIDIPHQQLFVHHIDAVTQTGKHVGVSTVPGYSYMYRKVLALAYVDPTVTAPGTEVSVLWGSPGTPQLPIRALVAPAPYKPDNRRVDLTSTSA